MLRRRRTSLGLVMTLNLKVKEKEDLSWPRYPLNLKEERRGEESLLPPLLLLMS